MSTSQLNDLADYIKGGNVQRLKDSLLQQMGGTVDINQLCPKLGGMSPLHFAAYIGDVEILDLILSLHNIDVDFRDSDGNTALHFASVMDKLTSVHQLLNSNAKVHLVNSAGKSPIDYAKSKEIKDLLKEKLIKEIDFSNNLQQEKIENIKSNLPLNLKECHELILQIIMDHHNFNEMMKEVIIRLLEEKHVAYHNMRLMELASGIKDKETATNFIDQLSFLEDENENQNITISNLKTQIRLLDQSLKEQSELSSKNIASLIEQHTIQLEQILEQNEESEKAFSAYQEKLSQEFQEINRLRNENLALKKKLLFHYSKSNLNELGDNSETETSNIEIESLEFDKKIQHLTAEKLALAEKIKTIGQFSNLKVDSAKFRDSEIAMKLKADRVKQDEIDESSGSLILYHGENGSRQIKAATPQKLIERLTDGTHYNNQFVPAFLLTFREFINKKYLLDQLIVKFNEASVIDNTNIQSPIRLKVCNILKSWIENYWFDFDGDQEMLTEINGFLLKLGHENPKLAGIISSALNRKISQIEPNYERKPINCPKPILPKFMKRISSSDGLQQLSISEKKNDRSSITNWSTTFSRKDVDYKIKFIDIDPLEIARQLTLIEHRLFTSIKATEFLNQAWMKEDKEIKAPNICKMTQWSNHVVHWVVSEIVLVGDLKTRALTIEKFIQLAGQLEKLNNFNGLKEILAGLQSSAVHRLKKCRAAVASKYLKHLEDLNKQTSSDLNFKTLRARIHACDPPLIPFPGVYQGDLVFLDTGSRSKIEGGLINFQKCQKIMSYISELQTYQQSFYHLEPVQEIMDYLKGYIVLSDEEAYNKSLLSEPRNQ